MSSLEDQKKALAEQVAAAEDELVRARRSLEKLEKVQDIPEPSPGTVLRFSRSLAGSSRKYTFVAFRASNDSQSWYVVAKKTTLQNLLGLSDGANTWDQLRLAIGDAKLRFATEWSEFPVRVYDYFQGTDSGRVFRAPVGSSFSSLNAEVWSDNNQGWSTTMATSTYHVRNNPSAWRPISEDEAREITG